MAKPASGTDAGKVTRHPHKKTGNTCRFFYWFAQNTSEIYAMRHFYCWLIWSGFCFFSFQKSSDPS